MESLFTLAPAELRRLLDQLLPAEGDFDQFLSSYFPDVQSRFVETMDRVAKTNMLFARVDRSVLSGRLRTVYPDAFAYLLVVEKGSDVGRQYPLPKAGAIVIGRGSDADIRLPEQDMKVSRRHALINISGTEVRVEKLGKLPIYLDGREVIEPMRLYTGNALEINQTVLRLHPGKVRVDVSPKTAPQVRTASRDRRSDPESMPAAKESANRLFWGLSDRLLEMNRVEEAERMMTHRLEMVLSHAKLGEQVEDAAIIEFLRRSLKLAVATKKAVWFGWIFDYASVLKYPLAPPLLDEISSAIAEHRPPIGDQLGAYRDGLGGPSGAESEPALQVLRDRLSQLESFCFSPAPRRD